MQESHDGLVRLVHRAVLRQVLKKTVAVARGVGLTSGALGFTGAAFRAGV